MLGVRNPVRSPPYFINYPVTEYYYLVAYKRMGDWEVWDLPTE